MLFNVVECGSLKQFCIPTKTCLVNPKSLAGCFFFKGCLDTQSEKADSLNSQGVSHKLPNKQSAAPQGLMLENHTNRSHLSGNLTGWSHFFLT